jgi:O-antigen/teichoic acid export membrane protein
MSGVISEATHARFRWAALFRRLPWHALATFGVRISAAGLTYLLQIYLARSLGEHEYGVFSLAWVWVLIGGYLGTLGLGQAAVRFLPGYWTLGDKQRADAFFAFSVRTSFGFSLLLMFSAFGGLFLAEAKGWVAEDAHWPFVFAALCLPFFAIQDMLEGLARSRSQMLRAFVPPYILRVALLLAMTFAMLKLGYAASASTAMLAALLATVTATAVQAALVLPAYLTDRNSARADKVDRKNWVKAALPLFLADGALTLRQYIDVILLGLLVEPAVLGVYFAVSRIISLLGMIEYSVAAMMAPRFSVASANSDQTELNRILDESAVYIFWPTLLAAAGIVLLSPWLLSFFGPSFVEGAGIAAILAIGPVIRALAGSTEEMLNMLGHGGATFRAHVFALLAAITGLLLLVPAYGIVGAAIAASLSAAINGIVLMIQGKIHVGLIARPWFKEAAVKRATT